MTQGTKRSRTDETTQGLNKAARVGRTTNSDSTNSNYRAGGLSQPAIETHERQLPALQNLQPGTPTIQRVAVPGPDYGRAQTDRPYVVPPPVTTNLEPNPTYSSLQAPSGLQSVQHGSSSGLCQPGPQQYGAPHSDPSKFGRRQSGPQLSGPHAQNGMHGNTYGSMNLVQTPACVNITSRGGSIRQSNADFQSIAQAGHLPPQSASSFPQLHDVPRITHISQSVARLSNIKALEILATAAVYHPDVLSEVERALSQQQEIEIRKGSELFGHLMAASSENAIGTAPSAQVTQSQLPQYIQARHSELQQPPPRDLPPQDAQPGPSRDAYENDEDDGSEQSDEDEPETESRSFDDYPARVDYILNRQYIGIQEPQQVHINEAINNIEDIIQYIADEVRPNSLYETKESAMAALWNIGMEIVQADGFLGNKVIVHMAGYGNIFVKALQWLYDSMTLRERERTSRDHLEDLEQLYAKRGHVFPGLDYIVIQFRDVLSQS